MGSDGALIHQQRRLTRQQFAHAFNYFYGEQLPGRPDQRVDQTSAAQNFVIGSRRGVGMTVYHYAKMLAGAVVDTVSEQTRGICTSIGLIEQKTTAVIIPAGSMSFQVLHATAVAHQFQNGRINLWPIPPLDAQFLDILDNDAAVAGATTIYVRTPVRADIAASTDTSICPSIYSAVQRAADLGTNLAPFVGVPGIKVPAGHYFWLPTWGLVQLAQGEPLNGIGGPEVYFEPGTGFGWKRAHVQALAANQNWQRAGYMAMEQTLGIDCDVWLQLDP